jgi:hypothetical protein
MEARGLILVGVFLVVAGCSSEPPPPPEQKTPQLTPEVSQRIDDALGMLNNNNKNEKWLKQLVDAAKTDEVSRQAAVDRTVAAVKRSYALNGQGNGILRAEGRCRAVLALDEFGGSDASVIEILKKAATDGNSEISAAASAALAKRGDGGSFAGLLQSIKAATDRPTQDRAAVGLLKLATPEKKDELLAALDAGCRDALAPVVNATLPAEAEARRAALIQIARENPNPQARILALDELKKANDQELVDIAQTQADADDPALRGYALDVLAAQEPKVAAIHLVEVLAKGSKDADSVAKRLGSIDAPEALSGATDLVADSSKPAPSRAACARRVLSRLKDEKAPASFKDPGTRDHVLTVLRHAIEDAGEEVASASIEALGLSGDESDSDALTLLLTKTPAQGPAIVKALGRTGGAAAVGTLVSYHQNDAKLRAACRDALVGMKGLRSIDFDQGFQLIQQLRSNDLEVRKSALAVLKALKGDSDVQDYNPQGEPGDRARSVERWVTWWKDQVAKRGG